jgi:hypothetical protein
VIKKILSATIAMLVATPAMAWHSISIWNETDPVEIVYVVFSTKGFPAQKFTLDLPGGPGWFRTFGPLHDDHGPCLRTLTVVVWNPILGMAAQAAKTPMDVCHETTIVVTGTWPTGGMAGASPLVVTHR